MPYLRIYDLRSAYARASVPAASPTNAVRENDGQLPIAKFPRRDDDFNAVLSEATALALAEKAGIAVPAARLETVANKSVRGTD